MTSKGDIKRALYNICNSMPLGPLAAAENDLREQIARLQAVQEGSDDTAMDSILAALQAELEKVVSITAGVINASNDIGEHAGRL